jgi:hypothetical protein
MSISSNQHSANQLLECVAKIAADAGAGSSGLGRRL